MTFREWWGYVRQDYVGWVGIILALVLLVWALTSRGG